MKKSKVLFVCTRNACRSQMAEGWARHLHRNRLEAYSAGTRPGSVDPLAVEVMQEAGVNMNGSSSKAISDMPVVDFDLVVTVCDNAREACPVIPGRKTLHKGFSDPPQLAEGLDTAEAKLDCYRKVRNEIRDFIETLPVYLGESHD